MAIPKKLKVDKSGGGVEIKPDSYIGLFSGMIHLGVQKNEYKGVTSLVDQVALRFELQDVLTEAGNPVVVTKVARLSMNSKSTLIAVAEAMGVDAEEGIDFEALVGQPVMVEMGYNQAKTKVSVKGFSKLPSMFKGSVKPLMNTPNLLFDVDDITDAQVSELPEWISKLVQNRIRNGAESNDAGEGNSAVDL